MESDLPTAALRYYSELESLARYINQAKRDIAAIRPADINTNFIPAATGELDAVLGATEDATNRIMDVCDMIGLIASETPVETRQQLIDCTTRIFEACNFQDITGQRITKVVETLKHIDRRIDALVKAIGQDIRRDESRNGSDPKQNPAAVAEGALLNGPQLPQDAISQGDIDLLLASK